MNSKSGLSMISMAVYVVLFFAFSAFAIGLASSMNYSTLAEKGEIVNNESLLKLQYNLINSAKKSDTVENITNTVVFSNNDEYTYRQSEKRIYKNGGVLISDVESFRVINISELDTKPYNFDENVDTNIPNICLEITFKKYNQELTEQIFIVVGDV